MMVERRVAARANLIAASTASVPELEKNTSSRCGHEGKQTLGQIPDKADTPICTRFGNSLSSTADSA
jgi:hypothetical protein